jgi:hypothetical protein
MILIIALMGGLFAVLTMIHFLIDWLPQSHAVAMTKHNHAWVRAKHCAIYMLGFFPLFWLCSFDWFEFLVAGNILFWSHFYLDTYHFVYLWAKYIRKPPEMFQPRKEVGIDGYITLLLPDARAGFVEFVQTPLGKILMIAIDQISHLVFLIPIAWMLLSHISDE